MWPPHSGTGEGGGDGGVGGVNMLGEDVHKHLSILETLRDLKIIDFTLNLPSESL